MDKNDEEGGQGGPGVGESGRGENLVGTSEKLSFNSYS